MAPKEDEANVFAIPELWQTSKWLDTLPIPSDETLFFADHLKDAFSSPEQRQKSRAPYDDGLSPVELPKLLSVTQPKPETTGFFKVPQLLPDTDELLLENEASDAVQSTSLSTCDSESTTGDIWAGSGEPRPGAKGYKTWDAFTSRRPPNYQPQFITEAGARTYDALLCSSADPLQLGNIDVPVVKSKRYFASLLDLALGRESVFFKREGANEGFVPVLPTMRISGFSKHVLGGLESKCMTSGAAFLQLRSFVEATYAKSSGKCETAFASAVDQILRFAEQHISVYRRHPHSLLSLQASVRQLVAILDPCQSLVAQLSSRTTDEEILSLIYHRACRAEEAEEPTQGIMQEVMGKVSRPWLEFMEEWLGTRPEDALPLKKENSGQKKGFIKVEAESFIDDLGEEDEDVDFRLDREHIPDFMPEDVALSVFETGRNLRFIQSRHPSHPLSRFDNISSSNPPCLEWKRDWQSIMHLESRVHEYRAKLESAILSARVHVPSSRPVAGLGVHSGYGLEFFGVEQAEVEEKVKASIERLNRPLHFGHNDALDRALSQSLRSPQELSPRRSNAKPHWSLLPVLSFASLADVQGRIVSRESLKLLFNAHHLRAHLRLHFDFQLMGNGIFCSKLSHALFDPELETAERHAGVARQGGTMGLRLNGRENWPPASSELRLALMGLLTESFSPESGSLSFNQLSSASTGLPGDLSFAVRDLSAEEIDRCMDPDSLEALDFLRLSYKTPSELTFIITPMILVQYDRIFKLLLRVLRMTYVVNETFRSINLGEGRWSGRGAVSYRFAFESRHFVSTVAAYFLGSGIAVPWKSFEAILDRVEESLHGSPTSSSTEKLQSPDRLREYHSYVLERITFALFLRKRQQPVLKLLEDIFGVILQHAKHSRQETSMGMATAEMEASTALRYKSFKKKVQVFITVCRGLTEKTKHGPKAIVTGGEGGDVHKEGLGEESLVARLVTSLDLCGYYTKH